ncbi:CotH kinase family protein [Paenibacillus koleovorans]|uniref:CotH kinase family protein n=1 Tax=Paenibacillus koleovorans TaxID=121608 RepID=UPI001FE89B8B|nr:CotH kinase family protein [Paenibacillus koleovorans]
MPVRHLSISAEQLKQLERHVWSDAFVDGNLHASGGAAAAKVRYRGGHTRGYPKRSFEVVYRGKTIHLNAEYDDPSLIRNALSFRFFEWIGVPSPAAKHVLVYLNGRSLGVYLEIESVNRQFFQKRGIPVKAVMYAVTDSANFGKFNTASGLAKRSLLEGYEVKLGGESDRRQLRAFIANLNALPAGKLENYLDDRLDVNNYLRWLAGAVFTGNYDGFDQNYAIYMHQTQGLYRMIPWDYEGTWGRNCYGNPCGSDLVRVRGYNQLTRRLLGLRRHRKRYQVLLGQVLDQHFTLQRLEPVVEEMLDRIAPYVVRDVSRKWSYSVFQGERRFIRTYIRERRDIVTDAISVKL